MNFESLFHTTFVFFVVMDALGSVPLFISILKPFDAKRQRVIIWREMLIALATMIFFLFFGQAFFSLLNIKQPALQIAGGVILFIIAIRMVFSSHPETDQSKHACSTEPMIVPLAIPTITGPGILTTITLYGGGLSGDKWLTLTAILIAWTLSVPILLLSSFLKKILGENGLVAVERLFGYLIVLIATQTMLAGITSIFKPFA